jgi:tetratricopeptide (TPR) repeat protein
LWRILSSKDHTAFLHNVASEAAEKSQNLCYFVSMSWLNTPRQSFSALVLTIALLFSDFLLHASFAQNSPEKQIEQHLQEAQAAEKAKDYNRAAAAYQAILKVRPQWALIHQSLGVVYHLQSRFPEAIASLEKALKLDPSLWGSHLFLGMGYYRTNQFLKAIPVLEQSVKLNPKLAEGEARLWLGSSFLALSRFDEALEQFRRLAELKPRDLEALYNLAEVCNRYSSALFERITVLDPESAEAHRLQAEWFEWQEKTDEGIGEYLQAAKARSDWEGIHLSVGNLYLRKGELAKAAQAFGEELRIAPNDPTAIQSLQAVRAKLGSTEPVVGVASKESSESKRFAYAAGENTANVGARPGLVAQGVRQFRARDVAGGEALLSRAVQENPKDTLAKLYLARCKFAMGNYDQAADLLKELDQFGSHKLEALYWTGKSYQELAAQTLEKMIGIDPNSYRVHQMTGALLEDKRKYAEAIDAYQKALKPSPDLMGIRFAIGNTYWKMQNLDEALVWLKDELARNPYHALANYRVGTIHLSKGSTDLAVPFLEKAVQANPALLGAQQDLAKAYTTLGRHTEAIAKLKLVAQADPEDASIRYLLSGAYKKIGKLEAAEAELKAFTQLRAKQDRVRRENLQKRISPDQPSTP